MTRFPLRRLRLRPGEEHRDAVSIELEPFELGGLRYLPVPHEVESDLTIVQAHVEREPEIEAGRRLHDRQLALDLVRHRQIAEPAELERLELDRDRVAVLLAWAEPEAAEREAGHSRSYK